MFANTIDQLLCKVYAGTILQPLPHLKAEKMKSITNIVNCVLNQKFVNGIVSITTDALLRMEVGILNCEGTGRLFALPSYYLHRVSAEMIASYRER